MEHITVKAYAKINLGLDVLRRREDGYHEVKMIMQTVDIFDTLVLTKAPKGISVRTDKEELPSDEHNLIYKAAKLVLETYHVDGGVTAELTKRIPIAAGMAGGSTDAAATIRGLNTLYGIGLSTEEMKQLAVRIGADVPYCIEGGTQLSEGIGEKLTKLPPTPQTVLVVAKPDINVSTKYVYENLHANSLTWHPDIDGMAEAICRQELSGVIERLGNVLATVTEKEYPVINDIKKVMREAGAQGALMSGSGPTVFGIFPDRESADRAQQMIREEGLANQIFVTGFIDPETWDEESEGQV